jgi:hypothetical protein
MLSIPLIELLGKAMKPDIPPVRMKTPLGRIF